MKIGGKAVYLQSITTCKLASAACLKRRSAPDGYSYAPILLINFGANIKRKVGTAVNFGQLLRKFKKKVWNYVKFDSDSPANEAGY